MTFIWMAIALFFIYQLIRLAAKVLVFINQPDTWDTMQEDILLLADIMDQHDRAVRVQYFINKLSKDEETEMVIRLHYYLLAVDVLSLINPDYLVLKREAREVTQNSYLAFQAKLKNIVQSELEYINQQFDYEKA